ncbi:MAG: DUF1638 domain-containing protein [Candidatus Sumerlaeia bacterium]
MASRIGIASCPMIAREMREIIDSLSFDFVEFAGVCRIECVSKPKKSIDEIISFNKDNYEKVFVFLGGCMSNTWAHRFNDPTIELIIRNNCFAFFMNPDLVNAYSRKRTYLLSPGWLARWPLTLKKWGFDQATARDFFQESVNKLVLIDSGVYPGAAKELEALGQYLDMPTEILPAGLDFFLTQVENLVLKWNNEYQIQKYHIKLSRAEQKAADYAMAMDIINNLADASSEESAIQKILEVFQTLFAPSRLGLLLKKADDRFEVHGDCSEKEMTEKWETIQDSHEWIEGQRGFYLPMRYNRDVLALLKMEHFLFGEYAQRYLNVAIPIGYICGLSIANVRGYTQLRQTIADLKTAMEEVQTLEALLPICSTCKKIRDDNGYWEQLETYFLTHSKTRFSHGICPECMNKLYGDYMDEPDEA